MMPTVIGAAAGGSTDGPPPVPLPAAAPPKSRPGRRLPQAASDKATSNAAAGPATARRGRGAGRAVRADVEGPISGAQAHPGTAAPPLFSFTRPQSVASATCQVLPTSTDFPAEPGITGEPLSHRL